MNRTFVDAIFAGIERFFIAGVVLFLFVAGCFLVYAEINRISPFGLAIRCLVSMVILYVLANVVATLFRIWRGLL